MAVFAVSLCAKRLASMSLRPQRDNGSHADPAPLAVVPQAQTKSIIQSEVAPS